MNADEMQFHTLPCKLDAGVGSRAYWSLRPTGHVIVFIHGYNGNAVGTWLDFPWHLEISPGCRGADLIFFGYDGVGTELAESAVGLYHFLKSLLATPPRLINDSLLPYPERADDFKFARLTLIAHSAGAVVSRLALLERWKNKEVWLPRTELVLFAPAHKGARVSELIQSAFGPLGPFGAVAAKFLEFRQPVLRGLKPGSEVLKDLSDETEKALADKADYHVACKVVWAAGDRVVLNQTFGRDATPAVHENVSHMSICKPSLVYSRPAREVLEIVERNS